MLNRIRDRLSPSLKSKMRSGNEPCRGHECAEPWDIVLQRDQPLGACCNGHGLA